MGASYGKQKKSKANKLDIVGRWTAIPYAVINSQEFRQLGYASRSLLLDMAVQYNSFNNGKLVCCTKFLRPLGWNSNDTINRALKELTKGGFLIMTRQGMRPPLSRPSWYALGWFGLNVTDGLDIDPNLYRKTSFTPLMSLKPKKAYTPIVGMRATIIAPTIGAGVH